MGAVTVGLSMSLDGFTAGPNDGPGNPLGDGGEALFEWMRTNPDAYGTDDFINPPERGEGTFVTDGIESALEQARAVAGDKKVALCAADVAQQYLAAGLLDEIQISLVPVLLGGGVRLFDHQRTGPIELEQTRVIESDGVTHLDYRIVR
jgi:dihydrofolate reductase